MTRIGSLSPHVKVDPLFRKAVGDAGRDGNPKHLVLERFDHQHNPEHEAYDLKQPMEAETEQEELRETQYKKATKKLVMPLQRPPGKQAQLP